MRRQQEERCDDLLMAILVNGLIFPLFMGLIALESFVSLNMNMRSVRAVREKLGAQWLAPGRPSVRYYYDLVVEIRRGDWLHRVTRRGPVTLYRQYEPLVEALSELREMAPGDLHGWYDDFVTACGPLLEGELSYGMMNKPRDAPETVGELILLELVMGMAERMATMEEELVYLDTVMFHWPEITGDLRERFQGHCSKKLVRYMNRPSRAKSATTVI